MPLLQTATSRALNDTRSYSKQRSKFMWGCETSFAAAGGTWSALVAPSSASNIEIVVRTVIGGLVGGVVGFIILAIMIFVWNLYRAPYKQRDEARRALELIPGATANSPKVALPELHFAKVSYHYESDSHDEVNINVLPVATGSMKLERAKVELSGEEIHCHDFSTLELWPGQTYSFGLRCKLPKDLPKGEHSIRIKIYSNNQWWASDWDKISY